MTGERQLKPAYCARCEGEMWQIRIPTRNLIWGNRHRSPLICEECLEKLSPALPVRRRKKIHRKVVGSDG